MDALSPEVLKSNMVAGNQPMAGVLELNGPKGPFQPKPLYDSIGSLLREAGEKTKA